MNNLIASTAQQLALEGYTPHLGHPELPLIADPEWAKVRAMGTALWLDTGDIDEIKRLYTVEFGALTTNNTLLNAEVQKGTYDEFVGHAAKVLRAADSGISEQELILEVAFILNARHALRLVSLFDARVSVELHTDLAHDVERSIAYGRRYHAICPERFIIKIPFTAGGLLSARQLVRDGIPVNFTLGFSARQNYAIARFTQPAWVNVFMGRLGVFLIENKLGDGAHVGEKATLATQRALLDLRARGLSHSHLIGASMRLGEQVATLAGLDVYTMPPKVAAAYRKAPVEALSDHVQDDPEVTLAEGVSAEALNLASLWDITPQFIAAVDALLAQEEVGLTPDAIASHFAASGLGDFMPDWTRDELATIARDGKIPVHATWKDRLASGALGLDALMNISALCSFITDQTALDNRVRGLI